MITHQGHAPGHSALFFPDSGILVAGDMCSDIEVPLLDLDQADPSATTWPRSTRSRPCRSSGSSLVTAHLGDGAEFRRRIELDRAYLENLRRGPELTDPRPIADWLVAQHKTQAARIAAHPPAPNPARPDSRPRSAVLIVRLRLTS